MVYVAKLKVYRSKGTGKLRYSAKFRPVVEGWRLGAEVTRRSDWPNEPLGQFLNSIPALVEDLNRAAGRPYGLKLHNTKETESGRVFALNSTQSGFSGTYLVNWPSLKATMADIGWQLSTVDLDQEKILTVYRK